MATVSSQLTRISDVEGALTLTSIGGGAGGSANAEIVIQGAQSAGRKQSNSTDHGFFLTVVSKDVSSAGVHAGIWVDHVHYGVLTKLAARLGSATTAYHEHAFPLAAYPSTGGWVRFWIDVARTPEATAGTFDKAALTQVGVLASLPAVSGNAPNLIMDASDFTTGGLLLTGTSGVFQDFVTADEANGTNKYGVVTTNSGVIFCLARLSLGSASSLVFSDSSFVIVFPNQSTVASNFMGISVDLQNASTAITWTNGVLKSAGAVKGDLVVTGTSGAFTVTGTAFSAFRLVTLTSVCSITSSSFDNCGVITAPGSTLTSSTVSGYAGTADTSALVWNVATNTNGKLNGMTFTKGSGDAHAIGFGTSSLTTMTLTNVTFSGYGADGTNSAALLFPDLGSNTTWTINITGGTTPTFKKTRAGDTVNIVSGARTVKVITQDSSGNLISGANVFLKANGTGTDPFPTAETVTSITFVTTTATVTHSSHGMAIGDQVYIKGATGADGAFYNGVFTITSSADANTYTYTMSGTPLANAAGTITATFIFLKGTTASGEISMSRTIPANQPVIGWARKHSTPPSYTPPNYKTATISGTVSSSQNTDLTAILISDD